jgi:hypothetical protein
VLEREIERGKYRRGKEERIIKEGRKKERVAC